MVEFENVSGKNEKHDVKIFTISTCAWCNKTKSLLKDLDVEYRYIDIDQLEGEEKKKIVKTLEKYNPKKNVPTLIIDDGDEVITGFEKEKIKKVLNHD